MKLIKSLRKHRTILNILIKIKKFIKITFKLHVTLKLMDKIKNN